MSVPICNAVRMDATLDKAALIDLLFKLRQRKNSTNCILTTSNINTYASGLSNARLLYFVNVLVKNMNNKANIENTKVFIEISGFQHIFKISSEKKGVCFY